MGFIYSHTNPITGIFFNSVKEASEAFGYKRSTLTCKLNGQNPNNTNLKYI